MQQLWEQLQDNSTLLLIKLIKTAVLFFAALLLIKLGNKGILKAFAAKDSKRSATLSALLKSILRYVVWLFAILIFIGDVMGIDIKALIAAAGVGAIAIGLGAQDTIKDIISGFFILFEDQFAVGDSITINNYKGDVESFGLRTTRIRQWTGDVVTIPNGQISIVVNHTRGAIAAEAKVTIAYGEDVDKALCALRSVAEQYAAECEDIIKAPTVCGVSNLAANGAELTLVAQCRAGAQYEAQRQLYRRIVAAFEKENITLANALGISNKKDSH